MNRQVGDHTLIIDSYTNDIKKEVLYFFMAQAFPNLKNPVTVIIDGAALSDLASFKMCNGGEGDNYYPWHVSDVTFVPKSGTHVKINSAVDYAFCVHGLQQLSIIGDNDLNYGLEGWRYASLPGNFGFEVANWKPKGQVFSLSVLPGGKITMRNFEAKHGFCGIKINGYVDTENELDISNFLIRDTMEGEGIYDGSTQPLPVTKMKGIIYNGIIARTACEGIQLQHCAGLTVKDVIIFATATAWLKSFQQYQDTGGQWVCAKGINILENIVLDGYRNIGLNMFGGDGTGALNIVNNMLMHGGHGGHLAMQQSCITGATWQLNNVRIHNSTQSYYNTTKVSQKPFIINQNGSDKLECDIHVGNIDKPQYVNSGFDSSDIMQWKEFYANWLQAGKTDVRTTWKKDQVVIDTNGGYGFYKCLVDHESETISPKDSGKFAKMSWNGSDYPPDDLRMINNGSIGVPFENNIVRQYMKGNKRVTVMEFGEIIE